MHTVSKHSNVLVGLQHALANCLIALGARRCLGEVFD
jgi:hypothetical protein